MKKFVNKNKKGGISILGILFLTVILIVVLSFFKINLRAVVESPETQTNFQYVSYAGRSLWNDYLKQPIQNVIGSIPVKKIWDSFISNMNQIKEGKPNDFQKLAPTVNFKSN